MQIRQGKGRTAGLCFSLAEGKFAPDEGMDPTVPRRLVGMEVEKPHSQHSGTTLGGDIARKPKKRAGALKKCTIGIPWTVSGLIFPSGGDNKSTTSQIP